MKANTHKVLFFLSVLIFHVAHNAHALPSLAPPKKLKPIIDFPLNLNPPPLDPEIQHEIDHERCRSSIVEMLDCIENIIDEVFSNPNYQGPSCRSCLSKCDAIAPDFHGEEPSEDPDQPPIECSRAICADIHGQICPAPPMGPFNPKSLCSYEPGQIPRCELSEQS